eukprot:2359148-Rhodomonas_salina.3
MLLFLQSAVLTHRNVCSYAPTTPCPVLTSGMLLPGGHEPVVKVLAERLGGQVQVKSTISLRVRYAMSGTDKAHSAISLRARYAVCGTHVAAISL